MKQQSPWSSELVRKAYAALDNDLQRLGATLQSSGPATHAQLLAVRTRLDEYFQLEEHNGYMDTVLKRDPGVARALNDLIGVRHGLMQTVEKLTAEAKTRTSFDNEFSDRLHAWIQSVRDYETRKNIVAEDAFNRDTGAED
jgi:hypothetical protein